jgi:hyperosmotically inducible periplasmic protein
MNYLRMICLSSIMAACASDPPPPAQGGEQFASNGEYRSGVEAERESDVARASEDKMEQSSSYQNGVTSSAVQASPQPITNAPTEPHHVALITTATASASVPLPPRAPTAAPVVAADNTRVNERDRSGESLTPTDQGSSEADRRVTQLVRQAVVKDDSLSFTAKNVKIITQNGKITLRGPVNTTQERTTIESAARKVAGAYQVDNLLEVKQ